MNVLVLGSGGREHALAWKLRHSGANAVYLHPGNAGTVQAGIPSLGDTPLNPVSIVAQAKEKQIGLIVIGPETLLAQGYADVLRGEGFLVVGPNAAAARLETSKIFAKEFMSRAGIPTAPYQIVGSADELLNLKPAKWPIVLKFDGLAAGKGVALPQNQTEIEEFHRRVWIDHEFGKGDHRILVEECLPGTELSYIGLCDGNKFLPLASATDFKRVGDGNTGPNTGGMGTISPSPYLTPALEAKVQSRIIAPLLRQLAADKLDYRGALYAGLMISPGGDPYVIEFNTRFGDPETQAVMIRLETDFVRMLEHTASASLEQLGALAWKKETAIYVVGAAEGYPAKPRVGDAISGLEQAAKLGQVFYSGVQAQNDRLLTSGGRVLGVGCLGADASAARERAYQMIKMIDWRGMHYRNDIGITEEH